MRYTLLIYTKEDQMAKRSHEEIERDMNAHWEVMEETRARGILEAVGPLFPTSSATTVRRQDGKAIVTDGPFAETKEQLAGYYILDCKDLDEAIAWAAKIPTACGGRPGCVEVRPIQDIPARLESVAAGQRHFS